MFKRFSYSPFQYLRENLCTLLVGLHVLGLLNVIGLRFASIFQVRDTMCITPCVLRQRAELSHFRKVVFPYKKACVILSNFLGTFIKLESQIYAIFSGNTCASAQKNQNQKSSKLLKTSSISPPFLQFNEDYTSAKDMFTELKAVTIVRQIPSKQIKLYF